MESEKRQRRTMHERLRMLVETHLPSLHHTTFQPKAGEVVIRQNTPAEQVLIVQEGELRVEHTEPGGTPQLIATVGPNEIVGEMSLIGSQCHSATVTVNRDPTVLLVIQSNDLLQAAIYDSDLVVELLALSSHRCQQTNRRLALILEAVTALSKEDSPTLERCCERLDREVDQLLSTTAHQLRQLLLKPLRD